ncbi:MAG: M13 family metallopeptidase [Rikenellaceae bacterium]|nr:M13 family metallopeptidase [Rikenellaceae bacterium]
MRNTLLLMIPLFLMCACSSDKNGKVPGIDLGDLDTSVSPKDDFYAYANGGWIKKNPLKPEYARYGTFDVLNDLNQERLNAMFTEMGELSPVQGSDDKKIVDLYRMAMDSTRLNAEGGAPLKKYLDEIYAVADKASLVKLVAKLHSDGSSCFFGTYVDSDLMDSSVQILSLGQSGLGIGDRDYYLDEEYADIREGYLSYLSKVFELSGIEQPQQAAENAFAVETRLAEVSWTRLQNRDIEALYNPCSSGQLNTLFPGFDFDTYFKTRNIPAQDKLNVEQNSFFKGMSSLFAGTPLEQLKDYVAARLIDEASSYLSDEYYDASFDFYSRQMRGVTEKRPRWKRAMAVPNSLLGEAVGKMYVAKYFPESSKEKVLEIVNNLRQAFSEHIDALDWMDDSTKAYAHAKLDNFTVKIGYPDVWKDYSALSIDPSLSYYDNLIAAARWQVADNMTKLGKPKDKTEWGMTPQTVNAYYNPTTNEICFPAAILQPPFFNADADDAVNYGAIGVVIGHEMTHGFDDEGRLFDKNGNMTNWWTAADDEAFKAKAEILVKQYDAIEVLPGLHADGRLSLGENIADHGGLSISYSAFMNSLGGECPEAIDGFTAQQRFFLGYAHVWGQNINDEEKERLTKQDVHSLGENRVNAALRNFQQFFDAFDIKEGDPMFLPEEERVIIW